MNRPLGPIGPAGYIEKGHAPSTAAPKAQVPAHPGEIKPGGTRGVGGLPF